MDINKACLNELNEMRLFESPDHFSRFSELIHCYCNYPFFNKGIVKCMYLSSWDMEHFIVILDILNDLTLSRSQNLDPMKDNGKAIEQRVQGYEKHIMRLSECFLNNEMFEMPEEEMEAEGVYIIERALEAANIIDRIFELI